MRTFFVAPLLLALSGPAFADVVTDTAGSDTETDSTEEDDKGCNHVGVGPASGASVVLGMGLLLAARRKRED